MASVAPALESVRATRFSVNGSVSVLVPNTTLLVTGCSPKSTDEGVIRVLKLTEPLILIVEDKTMKRGKMRWGYKTMVVIPVPGVI